MSVEFDVRGQQGMDFLTAGSIIMDYGQKQWFKVKMPLDLFLTNVQLFALQDINWHTGVVVWIIVVFLSAVWTLILTAPIHCSGSIGKQAI